MYQQKKVCLEPYAYIQQQQQQRIHTHAVQKPLFTTQKKKNVYLYIYMKRFHTSQEKKNENLQSIYLPRFFFLRHHHHHHHHHYHWEYPTIDEWMNEWMLIKHRIRRYFRIRIMCLCACMDVFSSFFLTCKWELLSLSPTAFAQMLETLKIVDLTDKINELKKRKRQQQ